MRPAAWIDAGIDAHRRVLGAVEVLEDDDVRAPSLLPGWSRAHVITHLARNADSHVWLLEGVARGEVRRQYPRPGMREADIEDGAARDARALAQDLQRSCAALERAWLGLDEDRWDHECDVSRGRTSAADLVFRRVREVEVHHTDLALGYSATKWPDAYVEEELARRLAQLSVRADHRALVTWLLGRSGAPELGSSW